MNIRAIVARAGKVNLGDDILTEEACRDAAAEDHRLEYEDGVLYFTGEVKSTGIVDVPYPALWMKTDKPPRSIPDRGSIASRMKHAKGVE